MLQRGIEVLLRTITASDNDPVFSLSGERKKKKKGRKERKTETCMSDGSGGSFILFQPEPIIKTMEGLTSNK